MNTTDLKRKQSLYLSEEMRNEMMAEAIRLDRSLSWIVQRAWKRARKTIRETPSIKSGDAEVAGATAGTARHTSMAIPEKDEAF
jgi:uncharacterized small protein (TIGR04563 family)